MTSFRTVAACVLALALLSGCGSDSDESPDISVPDASGTVALVRTDRAGETFPDTVAWSEIYGPPE